MNKGTLYLLPCPISDETTPWEVLPAANRAVMDALDYFIVENTRTARRFLSKAGIARPIDTLEFRELNEHTAPGAAVEELIGPLLQGRSAGVISEAGVPGVADPGALVVEACHRHDIRVVPLVGPSSIILAMMASGLNGQSFAFNGYLPCQAARTGPGHPVFRTPCSHRGASAALHRGTLPQCEAAGTTSPDTRARNATRHRHRPDGTDSFRRNSFCRGMAEA